MVTKNAAQARILFIIQSFLMWEYEWESGIILFYILIVPYLFLWCKHLTLFFCEYHNNYMKWIFITLAGGVLVFMAYSTYSSINLQLKSSAISQNWSAAPVKPKTSVEKIEKTITNTKNSQAK
jgi:hypothetical protein